MDRKKWITYGVAGAVGLTIVGGAAAATAAGMSLRTTDGTVVPGGPLVGQNNGVLDRPGLQLRVTDTSASVVSSPSPTASPSPSISVASPTTPASPASAVSVVSAATPVPPPAPAPKPPAPADSPASAPSAGSVGSAWSD
jgi:hypothetical protein